jgi:SAV_6107-like HEPN
MPTSRSPAQFGASGASAPGASAPGASAPGVSTSGVSTSGASASGVSAPDASRSSVGRFPATGLPYGSSPRQELPVPAHALPHRTPRELLTLARRGLDEAAEIRTDGMRYATAHLAALRAAAAVLAARAAPAAPGRRSSRVSSVWSLLVLVAPELSEWATFFAARASKRSAAEAGIPRVVSAREADELMRAAEQFIAVIEVALGFSYQPQLDGLAS